MLILHAALVADSFYLWGEDSEKVRPNTPTKRSLKGSAPHPFAASAARVEEQIRGARLFISKERVTAMKLAARLPSLHNFPVSSKASTDSPSNSLSSEDAAIGFQFWQVEAVEVRWEEAVKLLGRVFGEVGIGPELSLGDDLLFWAQTLRWVGALLARQTYLPNLVEESGDIYARWKPFLLGRDAESAARLAAAMPPAAHALTPTMVTPLVDASRALETFLGFVVDSLLRTPEMRAAMRPQPAANPVRRRVRYRSIAPPRKLSVHDDWMAALIAADGRIIANRPAMEAMVGEVRRWQRPLEIEATAPWRLCFRLEEPFVAEDDDEAPEGAAAPSGNEIWQMQYLLQARDEPSLQLTIEEALRTKSSLSRLLKGDGFNVAEYLFTALGQASVLYPAIGDSLKEGIPSGFTLDNEGAFAFLSEYSERLEQSGFGVFLPSWWHGGRKKKLAVRANARSPKFQGGSGLSLEELVHFEWEVALGDEKISWQELQTLSHLQSPLVRLRGQWMQLNREQIQAALTFWKKRGGQTATARDLLFLALRSGAGVADGGAYRNDGLEIEGVHATGWFDSLLKGLSEDAQFEQLETPAGFHGQLRPYQSAGYSWLNFLRRWRLGACLADDMGLGKTIQVLALLQHEWQAMVAENKTRPVLLICPTSVVANWRKESERFTPELPVLVHHGNTREREGFAEQAKDKAIVISSYALLHRDFEQLQSVAWAGVVLDEAQNIKNSRTKQAEAARSLPGDYRIALTGTPVENNIGDLWSLSEFLNPGLLGTQTQFRNRFFVPIQSGTDPEATTRLKRLTGPFILRRLKTDKNVIADLPDKMEMKVFCSLTREQASLYTAVVEASLADMNDRSGIDRRGVVLAMLTKLKQVCNHPAQFLKDNTAVAKRSGKLTRLTEMLEEVLEGSDNALIFTQFREMGDLLQAHLEKTFEREVLFLHGGTTKKARDLMVERFQEESASSAPRIFILSLKAGGVGLNLTRANHVFHFDRWWNPAVENQATDRAFRIGQTKNVQVHKFLCAGTLEERIDEMIEAKQAVANNVLGTGEKWLTELSTSQLRELLTLREDAVSE